MKRYVWLFYHTVNRSVLNLKSQDTIACDPSTHGAMLVPVIAGSDKTTVCVATGHQEYHPVYISPSTLQSPGHSIWTPWTPYGLIFKLY